MLHKHNLWEGMNSLTRALYFPSLHPYNPELKVKC